MEITKPRFDPVNNSMELASLFNGSFWVQSTASLVISNAMNFRYVYSLIVAIIWWWVIISRWSLFGDADGGIRGRIGSVLMKQHWKVPCL